ncbi:energy transducer TonB [Magnetospirillum aberrantis]|uniref:Energy transducer TonB n=1 Tax=Magnetospirillum aberrantis SpK TaxID=908842 RepID=A0A7C9UY06_9PROT|nr:energy transducer TonB [Magnetospirillum aberrantis]NFV79254.1 energy transducer TonB [Magnetospirillum aberrantis SpK]
MRRWRWAVLAGICGLHAAAVAALAPGRDTVPPKVTLPVLEARLIAEPEPASPAPAPVVEPPPKPTIRPPKPRSRPRSAAMPSPSPSPASVLPSAEASAAPAVAAAPTIAPAAVPSVASRPIRREPAAISCRIPAYPADARRRHETGVVTLALLIDEDGGVADRRLEASSGSESLDQAALSALSRCRFSPGTADGRPRQAWVRLRYVWKLE